MVFVRLSPVLGAPECWKTANDLMEATPYSRCSIMALADRDVLLGEWGWWGRCFLARMGMVGTLFLGAHGDGGDVVSWRA